MINNFINLINNASTQEMFLGYNKAADSFQHLVNRKYDNCLATIYELLNLHLYLYNNILQKIVNILIVIGCSAALVLRRMVHRSYFINTQKLDMDENSFEHFTFSSTHINFLSCVFNSIIIALSNFQNKACSYTNTHKAFSKLNINFALLKLLNNHSQILIFFWFTKFLDFVYNFLIVLTRTKTLEKNRTTYTTKNKNGAYFITFELW